MDFYLILSNNLFNKRGFMEKYVSQDNTVTKYIHDDGSETSIKHLQSCQHIINPITHKIESVLNDRNKFTIFISTSRGCFMECKFCHLTMKSAQFKPITNDNVLNNLKEAILESIERSPFLKDYFVKLSWMGMGDAFLESKKVKEVSLKLLDWMLDNNLCKGLDGVDLSTVYPKSNYLGWINDFNELNESLKKYPLNQNNNKTNLVDEKFSKIKEYKDRSPFRLFYSIHSGIQKTRDKLIPKALPLTEALPILLENTKKYNLIFHHIFLHGINDSKEELNSLSEICKHFLKGKELRILRYNECNWSFFHESEEFASLIEEIQKHVDVLKVQISPGSEVKAACGQFIVKDFIRKKKEHK